MVKNSSFKKLYLRIFISVTIVIFLPLVILSTLFFEQLINVKTQNFNKIYTSKAENISILVTEIMNTIENDMLTVKNDSVFTNYTYIKSSNSSVETILELSRKVNIIKQKYSFIKSVYFYDPISETIFTDSAGSYSIETFNDTSWISMVNENEVQNTFLRNDKESAVITTTTDCGKNRILAINIDSIKLGVYISNYYDLELGIFSLQDINGNTFLHTRLPNNSYNFNHKDFASGFITFKTKLDYNNWSSTFYVPKITLTEEINLFKIYGILSSFVIFFACLIFSTMLSKYIYMPIDSLVYEINKHMKNKDINTTDEIKFFKNVFNKISSENQEMSISMESYEEIIKNFTFKDFLTGKITVKEFDEFAHRNNMDIFSTYNKILIFTDSNKNSNRFALSKMIELSKVIDTYINNVSKGMCLNINTYYVAVIGSDDIQTLNNTVASLLDTLEKSFSLDAFGGNSHVFSLVEDAPNQYFYALNKLNYAMFFNHSFNYSLKNNATFSELAIPINIQTGLIRSILLKKYEDINKYINDFVIFLESIENMEYINKICFMMIGLIEIEFPCKNIFEIPLQREVEDIHTAEELKYFLIDISNKIIIYLSSVSSEKNYYVDQAKKYIEENYTKNLGVTNISEFLKISYPYLSKLFKDNTGLGIVDYISLVRINNAKELLTKTNLTINQVAEQVGYNNVQSFQRFFKKITETTPGDFRKLSSNKTNI